MYIIYIYILYVCYIYIYNKRRIYYIFDMLRYIANRARVASAYVISQHTSAYVSIRQHTYANIKQIEEERLRIYITHPPTHPPASRSSLSPQKIENLCQCLYCCTSKASKLSTVSDSAFIAHSCNRAATELQQQQSCN